MTILKRIEWNLDKDKLLKEIRGMKMTVNKKTEKELLNKYPNYFDPLDNEEQQLSEDLENNSYVYIKDSLQKDKYSKIAENHIKNKETKAITLRANNLVIEKIKTKAKGYGMNYQTYINLFLYQLAEGKFKIELE